MNVTITGRPRVLLLEDEPEQTERIRELLRGEAVDLRIASRDVDEALQQVQRSAPDGILVSLNHAPLTDVIERLDTVSGGSPIVVMLSPDQIPNSRDVLLAGARAYLPADTGRDALVDTIVSVLERERRRRAAFAKQLGVEVDLGEIIAIHGAKGGVGTTSVAVNLAVATQLASHQRVALVDANLYSGDVAAALHLMSRSSLADLTTSMNELDQEFLVRASVRHTSGLHAFLAPNDFVRAQVITGDHIMRILRVMRQHYDYVIVDTCSLPDQVTSAALEIANRIVLVVTPEVPALKNAARSLRLAAEFGYRQKISVVLNRAKSRGAVSTRDIEEHLHVPISVSIRSDGRSLPAAINAGNPVIGKRRSRFAAGIWQLTAVTTGLHVTKSTKQLSQATQSTEDNKSSSIAQQLTPVPEYAAASAPNGGLEPMVPSRRGFLSRLRRS